MEVQKKNKRGLSTVVIILIVVVLGIITVLIIWGPVRSYLRGQSELTQIQNRFFAEQINILSVYVNSPYVNLTLRKPAGEIKQEVANITGSYQMEQLESDIFSVVDLSGSMRQCLNITSTRCSRLGGGWSYPVCNTIPLAQRQGCLNYSGILDDKIEALQAANRDMISHLLGIGSNRIGLVAYRNIIVSSSSRDLTDDGNALNQTIALWDASGNTCICCGIRNATERFFQQSSSEKLKSMIVMSDGEANIACGGASAKADAINLACQANSTLNNLVIYSVGVGTAVDEATLTEIARCGGGKYFSVLNTSDLIAIYQQITAEIEQRYESLTSFNFLYVKFFNSTDYFVREKIFDIPEILETKTYNFNLNGELSGNIIRIEVYPVIVTEERREVIGPMLAVWNAQ